MLSTDDFDCTIRVRLPEGGSYTDADFREAVEIAIQDRSEELRVEYVGTSIEPVTEHADIERVERMRRELER